MSDFLPQVYFVWSASPAALDSFTDNLEAAIRRAQKIEGCVTAQVLYYAQFSAKSLTPDA